MRGRISPSKLRGALDCSDACSFTPKRCRDLNLSALSPLICIDQRAHICANIIDMDHIIWSRMNLTCASYCNQKNIIQLYLIGNLEFANIQHHGQLRLFTQPESYPDIDPLLTALHCFLSRIKIPLQ